MPENSIDSVLARLSTAISRGDPVAALRRAKELQALVQRLPQDVMPEVRQRLSALMGDAEVLRARCGLAVRDGRRQRQNVVAYRSFAGHS